MATRPPLTAYRIGDSRYPLLDGRGAVLVGGRWNSPGLPVIYASLSQACAMLEILAHTNIGKVPKHHKLVRLNIPATLKIEKIETTDIPNWSDASQQTSRQYGDDWLTTQRTVALIVPSVIAHYEKNILINPLHPYFKKIKANKLEDIHWDSRLFK